EDEELGAAVENLQDLDTLLQFQGDVLDARGGVDRYAELLLELADPILDAAMVQGRAAPLVAQHDVFRDGEGWHQHEVLVDHADPERDRVARAGDVHIAAAIADRTTVGVIEAIEDVHER